MPPIGLIIGCASYCSFTSLPIDSRSCNWYEKPMESRLWYSCTFEVKGEGVIAVTTNKLYSNEPLAFLNMHTLSSFLLGYTFLCKNMSFWNSLNCGIEVDLNMSCRISKATQISKKSKILIPNKAELRVSETHIGGIGRQIYILDDWHLRPKMSL